MTAKNNITLAYKDMSHTNSYGLIRGLQFSSFIFQYYGLMLDLLLVGLVVPRSWQASPRLPMNSFTSGMSPPRRHIPSASTSATSIASTLSFDFDAEETRDLIQRYLTEHPRSEQRKHHWVQ